MTVTSKSPRHRRRLRLASMEVLGFIDSPGSATRAPGPRSLRPAAPVEAGARRRDPLADWAPSDFASGQLGRKVRWSVPLAALLAVLLMAGAAYWMYQRPEHIARSALQEVSSAAATLQPELAVLAESSPGEDSLTPLLLGIDNLARQLYAASAGLPAAEATTRSLAAEAAGDALAASRMTSDAHAYRAAVLPVLGAPALEVDPDLVSLDEAARQFGEWQARFESVVSALPEATMPEVTHELRAVAHEVPGMLSSYLDALRSEDRFAAEAVIRRLSNSLAQAEQVLAGSLAQVDEAVADRLAAAQERIESLLR